MFIHMYVYLFVYVFVCPIVCGNLSILMAHIFCNAHHTLIFYFKCFFFLISISDFFCIGIKRKQKLYDPYSTTEVHYYRYWPTLDCVTPCNTTTTTTSATVIAVITATALTTTTAIGGIAFLLLRLYR